MRRFRVANEVMRRPKRGANKAAPEIRLLEAFEMKKFISFGVLVSLLFMLPAQAQTPGSWAPYPLPGWQAVITGQIEAFRQGDAVEALSYAGAPFHEAYPDPKQFFLAIIASGYAPIALSRSHSFGPFKLVAPDMVLQDVKLVDTDLTLYEAIYQLKKEPDGWRVSGVQLTKTAGVGV
jgi:hypothetical protein